MIKKLHMVAVLLMTSALSVFAQAPQLKWLSAQDGNEVSQESAIQIKKANDGNILVLGDFGSSDVQKTTDYWSYNLTDGNKTNETTLTGAPESTSNTGAKNLVLYKINAVDGKLAWTINTNIGDGSGKGAITATPDGGAMMILSMRHTNKDLSYEKDILCQFVDKTGTTTSVNWTAPGKTWVYQPVLVKVNAEGKITSAKHLEATGDFKVNDIVSDHEGNVYIVGSHKGSVNFGETANLATPTNKAGAFFVVKLNANGEAIWSAEATGDMTTISANSLTIANNKVYALGTVKGKATNNMVFGSTTLTPTVTNNMFITCLSTEGAFEWANVMNGAKNATNAQNQKPMCITVDGDNLYVGGSFAGDMINGSEVFLSNDNDKMLNSFVVKCNAKDGSFVKGIRIKTGETPMIGNTGEIESIHLVGNKVLASGYVLKLSSYLYEMDMDLTPESLKSHIIQTCNMGTTAGSVMVDEMLYSATKTKAAVTIPGYNYDYTTIGNWGTLYTCHSLSEILPDYLPLKDNTPYVATTDKQYAEVSYSRNFTNTNWQALYLPFGLNVADLQADFEVARINDVHQFDTNNDGTIDETKLEVIKLVEGVTEANVPYLIKAKTAGLHTLSAKNVLVKAAAAFQREMTSWNTSFVINGTYEGVADMFAKEYYALTDGVLVQATAETATLNGYRWYLNVQDRNGAEVAPTQIKLLVVDQNGNVTGVEEVQINSNVWPANVYNIQGKLVKANANSLQGLPKGVYIVNGKKVIR